MNELFWLRFRNCSTPRFPSCTKFCVNGPNLKANEMPSAAVDSARWIYNFRQGSTKCQQDYLNPLIRVAWITMIFPWISSQGREHSKNLNSPANMNRNTILWLKLVQELAEFSKREFLTSRLRGRDHTTTAKIRLGIQFCSCRAKIIKQSHLPRQQRKG